MILLKEKLIRNLQNKNRKLPSNLPFSILSIEEIINFENKYFNNLAQLVDTCEYFEREVRKDGLNSLKGYKNECIIVLYKLLKTKQETHIEKLKEYIEKVFTPCRAKTFLLVYIELTQLECKKDYLGNIVRFFLRGILDYLKVDPLSWQDDIFNYEKELNIVKIEIENQEKRVSLSFKEMNKRYRSFDTFFIKNFYGAMIEKNEKIFIKKYLEFIKEDITLFIKENHIFSIDKKIARFKENYKQFEELVEYYLIIRYEKR